MKNVWKIILIVAVATLSTFGYWMFSNKEPQSYGATVLTTNATDTISTFRTNVNTSLSNLNSAIGATVSYFTLSGNSLYPTSTGYLLGIGTTTPIYTLDIVGNLRVTATSSLGTVQAGTWNGSAIQDAYISSASTWNTKTSYWTLTGSVLSATSSGFIVSFASTTRLIVTSSLEIPYTGSSSTLSRSGQIAVDTSSGSSSLNYYDGSAERRIPSLRTISFGLSNVTSSDFAIIGSPKLPASIQAVRCVNAPVVGNIMYFNLIHATSVSAVSPNAVFTSFQTCSSTSTETSYTTGFSNQNVGSYTSQSILWLVTSSTSLSSSSQATIDIDFYYVP